MKRLFAIILSVMAISALSATAQQKDTKSPKVTRANYAQAARFSQKKVRKMVYSTHISLIQYRQINLLFFVNIIINNVNI